jgi:outer membrane lipoprotein SlyB
MCECGVALKSLAKRRMIGPLGLSLITFKDDTMNRFQLQAAVAATFFVALAASAQSGVAGESAKGGAAKPVAVCKTCGTVEAVDTVTKKGEGSGVGLVAGGVIGGVLGHQVGGGRGKDLATVAGAAGGAYAGHQIEKNAKKTTEYHVHVKMDDGTKRRMTYSSQPAYKAGDKVKIVNGKMSRI